MYVQHGDDAADDDGQHGCGVIVQVEVRCVCEETRCVCVESMLLNLFSRT